jgi:hypothetical protein
VAFDRTHAIEKDAANNRVFFLIEMSRKDRA